MTNKILIAWSVLLTLFLAASATASTVVLRPDGQGAQTRWANVNCQSSAEWQCVDEAAANTTDYLYTSSESKETFTFSNSGIAAGAAINSVTLSYYATRSSKQNSCFAAMTRSGSNVYRNYRQL